MTILKIPEDKSINKMGKSRYRITDPLVPHFFTATINQWIPVFTRPATVNIILESWRYLQQSTSFRLYGYVILENHVHFIAQSDDLIKHIQSFKSWTARSILDHLTEQNADFLLKQFAFYKKAHKTQSQYQLWQEGSHPQLIQDEVMLRRNWNISTRIRLSVGILSLESIGAIRVLGIMLGWKG